MLNYEPEKIVDLYQDDVLYHAPEVERLPEELEKMALKDEESNEPIVASA